MQGKIRNWFHPDALWTILARSDVTKLVPYFLKRFFFLKKLNEYLLKFDLD